MDVKFIKPAQLFLVVILFVSLFVPYALFKRIDEDNVTQTDITASATSAWSVDNSFVMEDWYGIGPQMRYKSAANSPYASEAATISYSSGSYTYVVTSTTNTVSDYGWGLCIPLSKKVEAHLVDDGATDMWVNLTLSSTNNDVRAVMYVRAFGEYDSGRGQHEYEVLGQKQFTMASTNLNYSHRFKYRDDPKEYAACLALPQRWDKDVQMFLYFFFFSNYNPDASDTLTITLDTEDVDENESVPTKAAAMMGLIGVLYFVVAAAMSSAFNPFAEIVKKMRGSGAFFLVLGVVMLLLVGGSGMASAGDTEGEDEKGDNPYIDISVWICIICLGVVGGISGFSVFKGGFDAKNIIACAAGVTIFVLVGFFMAFHVPFILLLNPEFNLLTLGAGIFVLGFLSITAMAFYNYAQGKDEVWSE